MLARTVDPKMPILFTHPNVVPRLYDLLSSGTQKYVRQTVHAVALWFGTT